MTDPLSDVLRSVRLVSGVFLDGRFSAPWCLSIDLNARDCVAFKVSPAQLITYHVVTLGSLILSIEGEPAIDVRAGEIILFPHNDGHVMSSAPHLKPVRTRDLVKRAADGGLPQIVHGGGGAETHIVCGFLGTEDAFNPLLATLPRVLKIDVRDGTSRDWIEASVKFAAAERALGRLASSNVMSRLSEVLLVEAVREYASACPEARLGWLKGASDVHIGRALALMHHKLGAPWSAEALARAAALSRSAFVERFTALVGMPPIRYLTVWRLQTAKLQLRETQIAVAQLAHDIGYESEEAFSRAFKREFGVSPAKWRSEDLTA